MAKVGIVMGSDSDMPVMAQAAEVLEQFGIDFEMTIISAHREPDTFFEYAKSAESRGMKVRNSPNSTISRRRFMRRYSAMSMLLSLS